MDEHYFSADPGSRFTRAPVRAHVWGHWLELTSGSGVFSQGRLDAGTGVLLRTEAPPEQARTVLDLGCGYGVIGLAIAVAVPDCVVTAVDVNERALLLANDNAVALGVADRFHAVLPDQVASDAAYDEVWSNPPIRIGKVALHRLLLHWLPRLQPQGVARLVVARNLGADSLATWLTDQGFPTGKVASAKGFRVLHARGGAEGRPVRDERP